MVTIDGIWIGEWIYWPLYTRLGTTSNYSAIADIHTLQITAAHAKPQSCIVFPSRCLVSALNNGDSSAFVLTSLTVGQYYSQPNSLLQLPWL
jgi:hypothetical protein